MRRLAAPLPPHLRAVHPPPVCSGSNVVVAAAVKCNAPNNARRWRLVRCTTIPNGTEFSVSLPGHATLLPCHPAVFCALQEVL